ncbi:MAG TPA: hypothetical protein ENG59_05810 [Chloroflexi bacterium]|nr:MAG: hypothetical protein DRI46_07340 [Chloroflexota bacterium]HDD55738.1 hypothetical protein [Chloroflexota bacterium]
MDKRKRTSIFGGVILILIGALLFVAQIMPDLIPDFWRVFSWPWIIVGVGLFLLALGAALGEPGLAVPATIVGGIGGILAYQFYSNDWTSWSYIWTMIPGFVGLGIILMSLLGGDASIKDGANLLLISFILLAVFGSFFGALGMAGQYWPVLLILLGVILLGRSFFDKN